MPNPRLSKVAYTLDPSTGIYIDPVSGATSMDPLGQTAVTNPSLVQQAKRNLAVSHGLLDTLGKYGAQFDQSITGEQALSQHLNDVIAGRAPSVAGEQLQQGLGQIRQQADSQASGLGGANAGLARLQAIQAGGAAAATTNQQAALLRAQEQAAAVQNQGAVLGNMANQSANMYGTNVTGAANFSSQAGSEAATQAQIDEQRSEANKRLIANLVAAGGAGLATLAAGPGAGAVASKGLDQLAPGSTVNDVVSNATPVASAPAPQQALDLLGPAPTAPAANPNALDPALYSPTTNYEGPDVNPATGESSSSAYTSDEREKTDIQKAPMERFLDHIAGFTYDYKNPGSPGEAPGKRVGPMAQDVQKGGPIGRSMVVDGAPLKLDVPNAVGATLAAVSYLNEQIKALKQRKAA